MRIQELRPTEVKDISAWQYPGSFSKFTRTEESLQPRALCFGVHDSADGLTGYLLLGPAAYSGCVTSDPSSLDLAFAMHPLRMRQGRGTEFVRTVAGFAEEQAQYIGALQLRVVIDDWNVVAATVCREVGFEPQTTPTGHDIVFHRPVGRNASQPVLSGHYLG